MTETTSTALLAWEACCKSHGLLITAPRRAILTAMLHFDQAHDAVALLQAAREHYAATSIGTVYRWLRELEQRGLVRTQLQPHGRCRWRLHDSPPATSRQTPGSIRMLLQQVQGFLRELERLGFAEVLPAQHNTLAAPGPANLTPIDPSIEPLRQIAERLGYRLA